MVDKRQRGDKLQATSVSYPQNLPLVTTIQTRDGELTKDSRLVNAIVELEPVSKDYWIYKRIGLAAYQTKSGDGLGAYFWQGDEYVVFGTTLYRSGVAFGTVDGSSSYVFDELRGLGWLVLNNGVKAYYTDGATLTELAQFRPAYAGGLIVGSTYEIIDAGTSDFTAIGSPDNNPGTQFTATGLGDALTTGTAAVVAPSLLAGVRYEIYSVGDTDFTLIGAATNTVSERFTATGPGTGTGSCKLPNFPENHLKGWAYLDGTLYVIDANCQIFGTSTLSYGGVGGFDDPRIWDSLNLIVARSEPGAGVSIIKHLSYVLAFKANSVEPYYDAAAPVGSPLQPVQGSVGLYGCASADSIQDIDGTVFWLTTNQAVEPQVARMDNLRTEIISTPPVQRLLKGVAFTGLRSWVAKISGHRLYGLMVPTANITIVYDIDQGLWYIWTDANGNYWPIVEASRTALNLHTMQHESNGVLYYADSDFIYPNDNGEVVPVDIYTPNYDGGVDRRKTLAVMRIFADQTAGSKLLVRYSDDDYTTWSNFREVDLGKKRPFLDKLGTFYRRAFHFRHYANTKLRIKAIALQQDIGTL